MDPKRRIQWRLSQWLEWTRYNVHCHRQELFKGTGLSIEHKFAGLEAGGFKAESVVASTQNAEAEAHIGSTWYSRKFYMNIIQRGCYEYEIWDGCSQPSDMMHL